MNCIEPPALSDQDLLHFVAGEADERIATHIRMCAACRQRALEFARFERGLVSRLWRRDCPPPHALAEQRIGLLGPEASAAIVAHLTECPHCRAEGEQFAAFFHPDLLPAPPPEPRLRTLIARLLEPLSGGPLGPIASGVRGSEAGALRYAADDLVIELERLPAEAAELIDLLGLVIDPSARPWHVEARQADALVAQTTSEPDGSFVLLGLAPGRYDLVVRSETLAITMPDLVLEGA